MKGIGGHQRAFRGKTDEWLTPPEILEALGPFDLDPCSPLVRPWDTATKHFTVNDNGLKLPWGGRVWLNPPYGPQTGKWLSRMAQHGNGVALIFARTDTNMFYRFGFGTAEAIKFIRGRLFFHHPDGRRAEYNAGGPSALLAWGQSNVRSIQTGKIPGWTVLL